MSASEAAEILGEESLEILESPTPKEEEEIQPPIVGGGSIPADLEDVDVALSGAGDRPPAAQAPETGASDGEPTKASLPAHIQGVVEQIGPATLKGWAFLQGEIREQTDVDLMLDGVSLGSVRADIGRLDLEAVFGQGGCFAFQLPIPAEIALGDVARLEAAVHGFLLPRSGSLSVVSPMNGVAIFDGFDGIDCIVFDARGPLPSGTLEVLIDGGLAEKIVITPAAGDDRAARLHIDLDEEAPADGRLALRIAETGQMLQLVPDESDPEFSRLVALLPTPAVEAAGETDPEREADEGEDATDDGEVALQDSEEEASSVVAILPTTPSAVTDVHLLPRGNVDALADGKILGWAVDPRRFDRPVSIDLYIDGPHAVSVLADTYRADLKDAGIGDGRHGFQVPLPLAALSRRIAQFEIRITGTDVVLPSGFAEIDLAALQPSQQERAAFPCSYDLGDLILLESSWLGMRVFPTGPESKIELFPRGDGNSLYFNMRCSRDIVLTVAWDDGEGFSAKNIRKTPLVAETISEILLWLSDKPLARVRILIPEEAGLCDVFKLDFVTSDPGPAAQVSDVVKVFDFRTLPRARGIRSVRNCGAEPNLTFPMKLTGQRSDPQIYFELPETMPAQSKFLRLVMSHDTAGNQIQLYYTMPHSKSWSEDKCVTIPLSPQGDRFEYLIPMPATVTNSLRLDPLNADGRFEIEAMELWTYYDDRSKTVKSWKEDDLLYWATSFHISKELCAMDDEGLVVQITPQRPIPLYSPAGFLVTHPQSLAITLSTEYPIDVTLWGDLGDRNGFVRLSKTEASAGSRSVAVCPGITPFVRQVIVELGVQYAEAKAGIREIKLLDM